MSNNEHRPLNQKMRLFVESYDGNIVNAMRYAGYTGTDEYLEQNGNLLLKQPQIQEAIRERSKVISSQIRAVATRTERLGFYTSLLRNEDPYYKTEVDKNGITVPQTNIPMGYRLKGAELLSKAEGDFIERIDIRQQVTITDVINDAYMVSDTEEDLDAIEAEYEQARAIKEEKAKGPAALSAAPPVKPFEELI